MTGHRPAHPPFDPEVAHALRTRDDVVTGLHADEIGALRARSVSPAETDVTLGGELELTRHVAAGRDGTRIPIVMLRPGTRDQPLPVLYHVHGGGLVVGTPDDDLPSLAAVARSLSMAVVSVDYRLAPEHPYPAAVDDVYDGLLWLAEQAGVLRVDADRIVIGGVSAGGGLAAATALLVRDRGGPALQGQMLVCPMLDDRNDSASALQMTGIGAWDRTANETAWTAYLGPERTDVPIYASPARAADLSRLPPLFIDVGSAETFRDEVVDYAARFWACGGDAELHVWPGGAHGFDALVPDAAISRSARAARTDWLARRLVDRVSARPS